MEEVNPMQETVKNEELQPVVEQAASTDMPSETIENPETVDAAVDNDSNTGTSETLETTNEQTADETAVTTHSTAEAEAAPYTMTVNDAGQTVLTLTADDGIISWVRE